jgi:hypothetical protein
VVLQCLLRYASVMPIVLFLSLILLSPAFAQQKAGDTTTAPKARRIFTNDSLNSPDPASSAPSVDGTPPIPGLIQCGHDLKCFLPALDKASPAVVTRTETVREGTGVITMASTWWTSQFSGDRCKISFRVDSLDARVNDEVVPEVPGERSAAEAKLAEMKRDFESIRGKTQTCSLAVKDLKTVMTSSAWSLVSLGMATAFGKDCSGPMFDSLPSQPSRGK